MHYYVIIALSIIALAAPHGHHCRCCSAKARQLPGAHWRSPACATVAPVVPPRDTALPSPRVQPVHIDTWTAGGTPRRTSDAAG